MGGGGEVRVGSSEAGAGEVELSDAGAGSGAGCSGAPCATVLRECASSASLMV
jgi:hypothetical protein